jgi:hypothetical protein
MKVSVTLPLLALLTLTGCASTGQNTVPPDISAPLLKERIPQELLQCLPEPNGSKVVTERQVAHFITSLKHVSRDCRNKLKALGVIISEEAK